MLACAACGSTPASSPSIDTVEQPLVYGADDRRDVADVTDAGLKTLATAATVALIEPSELRFSGASGVDVKSAALSDWDDYCAGTPFLAEPTSASCGGVLIDDDLVLTAAHCVRAAASCRELEYVFGYGEAQEGTVGPLSRGDVFGCRGVAVTALSDQGATPRVDYAIVQLDRSAVGNGAPGMIASVAPAKALTAGEAVPVIGFPSGLPVKVDTGAKVVDADATLLDAFTMTSDTFHGSSGSPVFDGARQVVGVFSEGTADFVDQGSCRAVRALADGTASNEWAVYAAPAIAALCATGFPSRRLCQIPPRCGDGICTGGVEDHTSCAQDCAAPSCGDKLCEESEWSTCPADCGDRRPANVPDGWFCEPAWYGTNDGCNCGCGAPDPDCGGAKACETEGPGALPVPAKRASKGCAVRSLAEGGTGEPRAAATTLLFGLCWLGRRRRRALQPSGPVHSKRRS